MPNDEGSKERSSLIVRKAHSLNRMFEQISKEIQKFLVEILFLIGVVVVFRDIVKAHLA